MIRSMSEEVVGAWGAGKSWKVGDILDGRGEGGRAQKLCGQEKNRLGDETAKGA